MVKNNNNDNNNNHNNNNNNNNKEIGLAIWQYKIVKLTTKINMLQVTYWTSGTFT